MYVWFYTAMDSNEQGQSLDFWQAERDWQANTLQKPFQLLVADPQTRNPTFGKSYTTYLVSLDTDSEAFEVRRRFSDFDWLRGILMYRFHGVAIPCLPPKKLVGNQNNTFIEERRQGLEKWLREVAASPYLREDTTFQMFLRTKDTNEFEQQKKAADMGAGSNPKENKGLDRWFGVLRHYSLPSDHGDAVKQVEQQCNSMKEILERAVKVCSAYFKAAQTMNDALQQIRDTCETWRSASEHASSNSHVPQAATADQEMTEVVGNVEKAFSEAADLSGFAPNEINMFLVASLSNELRRVNSLSDLLMVLRQASTTYEEAFTKLDTLQFKEKQLRSKGKADQANALEPKITEADVAKQRAKERVDDITKGILNVEAAKVSRARVQNIRSTMGQFAALNVASGERTQTLWQTLIGDLNLDSDSMVHRAQETLQGRPVDESDGGLPGMVKGAPTYHGESVDVPKESAPPVEDNGGATFSGTAYSGDTKAAETAPAEQENEDNQSNGEGSGENDSDNDATNPFS